MILPSSSMSIDANELSTWTLPLFEMSLETTSIPVGSLSPSASSQCPAKLPEGPARRAHTRGLPGTPGGPDGGRELPGTTRTDKQDHWYECEQDPHPP